MNIPLLPKRGAARRLSALTSTLLLALAAALLPAGAARAQEIERIDIDGPEGSASFGKYVTVLPNGNIVVADPDFVGPTGFGGAVHLYDGETFVLISSLIGDANWESVGNGGITVLANGNFVVISASWGELRGAVTWGDAYTGFGPGQVSVSAENSLVGEHSRDAFDNRDAVGSGGVTALPNGNYVVRSPEWDNGDVMNAGAVTWGNGATGTVGLVSAANSLVGGASGDFREGSVHPLPNGNYVVRNLTWHSEGREQAGAVTWGDGDGGTVGPVSAENSLVGTDKEDLIGSGGIVVLANGNYVVASGSWHFFGLSGAGAVTWGSGTQGVAGPVSVSNSLIGKQSSDGVGAQVTALTNGNYVVRSSYGSKGAITWANGSRAKVGVFSPAESLVGSDSYDLIGSNGDAYFAGVVPLSNGNYVVVSPWWNGRRGAVTWANGRGGTAGVVSAANSLVGSTEWDMVGNAGAIALTNGHYVAASTTWDDGGVADVGAVTWGNGSGGTVGPLSGANSLVGSKAQDYVGTQVAALANGHYVAVSAFFDGRIGAATWADGGGGTVGPVSPANSLLLNPWLDTVVNRLTVMALANGNYVVVNPQWDNNVNLAEDAGAVTWADGSRPTVGRVATENSLVGTTAQDMIGLFAWALPNGDYLTHTGAWDSPNKVNAGAVTWGDGEGGTVGPVSAANSLVGWLNNESVGNGGITVLPTGDYVVVTPNWNDGQIEVGAATWGRPDAPPTGFISAANSVLGRKHLLPPEISVTYDPRHAHVVFGFVSEKRVVVASYGFQRMLQTLVTRIEE